MVPTQCHPHFKKVSICVLDVKRKLQRKTFFFYENLPLVLIQDHKSWERWLQKDSIVPNRLQTRACNSMPKTAPLFSGEPYIVPQWCSSPPASYCSLTTTKKLNPKLSGAYVHWHHPNSLGSQTFTGTGFVLFRKRVTQSPAHLGIAGCLGWRYLSQPSSQRRLPSALFLAALQLFAICLPYTTTNPLCGPDPSSLCPGFFQKIYKLAQLRPEFWKTWNRSSCWKCSGPRAPISSRDSQTWMWTLVF